MHRLFILIATIALTATVVRAEEPPETDAPPPPPMREPMPPKIIDSEDQLEPEVVIRREERRTVEEYRVGGMVYMIRIVPDIGPAYYLIDTTGDGNFDSRHEHMEPVRPAHWKIFEW